MNNINKISNNQIQNRILLQKKISSYLGLPYDFLNKSVRINYYKGKDFVNIIINNDWDNKIDFNLNLLNK
tara:strand:- start:274 stop:483 length:210 start_codon:yes stop_codon:yes gene_type:complete